MGVFNIRDNGDVCMSFWDIGGGNMSYIVPRDIPKTCDECYFSAYSAGHNSLICMLDENILCVERDERYAFCKLIEVDGSLFNSENVRQYLGSSLPTNVEVVREVTE